MAEQRRSEGPRPDAPGWNPDPYGRHELRYWDGIQWTGHVSDGGRAGLEWADVPASADAKSTSDVAVPAGATLAPAGATVGGPTYGSRNGAMPLWATTRAGLAPLPGRPPPSPHFSGPLDPTASLAGSPIGTATNRWYRAKSLWLLVALVAIVGVGALVAPSFMEADENPVVARKAAPAAPAPSGYRLIQTESYRFAVPQAWTYERFATGVMEPGRATAGKTNPARDLTVASDPVTHDSVNVVPYDGLSGNPGGKAQLVKFESAFRAGVTNAQIVDLNVQPFHVHGLPAGKLVASVVGPDGLSTVISTIIRTDDGLYQVTVTAGSIERAAVLDTLVLPTFASVNQG